MRSITGVQTIKHTTTCCILNIHLKIARVSLNDRLTRLKLQLASLAPASSPRQPPVRLLALLVLLALASKPSTLLRRLLPREASLQHDAGSSLSSSSLK